MPTQAEFEQAAALLEVAAIDVATITVAAENANAEQIVQGGALGRLVPQRIRSATEITQVCQMRMDEVAATCRERAMIIAEYNAELFAYDVAYGEYLVASDRYWYNYSIWLNTEGAPHPGIQPEPPLPPDPPPAWADVRRP